MSRSTKNAPSANQRQPASEGQEERQQYAFFPIETFDTLGLPPFCAPVPKSDDPSLMTFINYWAPLPSDDPAGDWERGKEYADEAVAYAERGNHPMFIPAVIGTMNYFLKCGLCEIGPLEAGFLIRLRDGGHLETLRATSIQ